MALLLAIAGATTGSTALLLDPSRPGTPIIRRGPGLLPLEQDEGMLYADVRAICGDLAVESGARLSCPTGPLFLLFALSSRVTPRALQALQLAVRESALGLYQMKEIEWITRGRACYEASLSPPAAIILKVGTVAFAHAFHARVNQSPADARVGGWGLLSGDDGGGYYIGRQLIYRLFEEADGRRRRTSFSERFMSLMGESTLEDSIVSATTWIRQRRQAGVLRRDVSELARIALFLAGQEQDLFALRLLRRAAHLVAHSAYLSFARLPGRAKMDYGSLPLFLHGGLIQSSALFAQLLIRALQRAFASASVNATYQPLQFSPIAGCAILGLRKWFGYSPSAIVDVLGRGDVSHRSSIHPHFEPAVVEALAATALRRQ